MENARKIALGFTLFFAIIAGIRVYLIHRERVEASKPAAAPVSRYKVTDDDLTQPRQLYPTTLKDAKTLIGKSVWVSAGGQFEAYPCNGHAIDFTHSSGYLLGADELQVKDFIQTAAPKTVAIHIPPGDKQVYLIFTRPGGDAKKFATPVGYIDATGYTFNLDNMFFYDDVHSLYKSWPQATWDAVAKHEAVLGMTEKQVALALGQPSQADSNNLGNRTAKYYNMGKSVSVTFQNGKATNIEPTQL
ncbi:MAG: hypothetical protein P4L10_13425 [Acidobacteriaceae bacterium]|jgi:hypothetical protein|nr:hypothetical protein [Acidobacteriaceae bacterium]